MPQERFLVTGAMGCLGAWVTKLLLDEGVDVAIFDLSDNDARLRAIIDDNDLARAKHIKADITDREHVGAAVAGRTHVIHLAALQVPFVRADPAQGAAVNVTGTVNVFEAVREHGVEHLSYASSFAVYGHPRNYDTDVLPAGAARLPDTLYGVYKMANEDTARVFWQDDGVPSIGLRPYTVFGPLRDQGLTSQPTLSIEAAVRGEPYHIEYGGTATYQFAPDVALQFIMAAREGGEGAGVYTLGGDTVSVGDFVSIVHEVTGRSDITIGGGSLPFPGRGDDRPLLARFGVVPHTPLREAIVATAEFFEARL